MLPLNKAKGNRSLWSTVGDLYETRVYEFLTSPELKQKVVLDVEWGPTDPLGTDETFPHEYNNEDIEFVRFTDATFTHPPPAWRPSDWDSDMDEGE